MDDRIIYISYYTSNYKIIYEQYLKSSLKKFDLKYYVKLIDNKGSWKLNTNYKPLFIQQCLQQFKENLVFCDVDATINSYPELFYNIPQEFDIGVYFYSGEIEGNQLTDKSKWGILTGTLYIKNNEKVFNLINKWISFLPDVRWEQTALTLAINESSDIKVYNLPREYCYITSKPDGSLPNNPINNPIISHYQISRKLR